MTVLPPIGYASCVSGIDGHKRHNGYRRMTNELDPQTERSKPMVYQIRIKGHLRRDWTDWFSGMSISLEDNGDTLLTGPVIDQAALHGLLRKVRDLGLPLVTVIHVEPEQADVPDVKQ
jgi:hypothetical protein